MVEDGEVARAQEYAVGAGIMIGSRLLTGAGYTLKVPAIDLAEVGAGGGSHVWIDAGGALQVGPESAGALPGPGLLRPGRRDADRSPTPTSLLGYINPAASRRRRAQAQRRTRPGRRSRRRSQTPLGMALERAAYGAHLIAASNMIRAIKAVSTERGRDPREFALFAFGGNGPLFAAGMAAALGITPDGGAAVGRPVLVVRPALRRRRASLRPHVPAAAAPGRSGRDRRGLGRAGATRRANSSRSRASPATAPGSSARRRCTTRARATS